MSSDSVAHFHILAAHIQRNNGYLARAEIERLLSQIRTDPSRLEPYGFKVYSQNDEDGILEEIFRRLGLAQGRFVEVGVSNGLECNSLYLIHKGWRGVWIEGDSTHQAFIEGKFSSVIQGGRLRLALGYLTADNMAQVFQHLGIAEDVDFLSIDIDGSDIYLLEALPIAPKVICIEYNAKFPANIDKQPVYDPDRRWGGTDYMGSSLKAIARCAAAKGYRLVGTNIVGINAFFVREDLAGDAFPADASPEALYNPARYYLWKDHYIAVGHRADFGPYVDLIDGAPSPRDALSAPD